MSQARPAWVIGHVSVKDAARWEQYRQSVPATLGPFGGKVVMRGRVTDTLSGTHRHSDAVVLEFPSVDAARGWHASAAYQELIPLRREAAEADLVIVAG
ncbi:MAG TPA: DUF1330 domain-containing protein [Casimicrobiaceae bacterium]|nr:DUF1330 domain-containing protein [Casimicrobiaceae bacterium]